MSTDLLQIGDTVTIYYTLFDPTVQTVYRIEGNVATLKPGLRKVGRRIYHGKYVYEYRKRITQASPDFVVTARVQS